MKIVKNNLWIGSNYSGFYRYNRELDKFEQYCKDPNDLNSLSNDNVSSIFEDNQGTLWIGTELGLNRFNFETGQFMHYMNAPSDIRSISNNVVSSITETPDGALWIGTENGLNRLVRNGEKEYFIRYDLSSVTGAGQS